MKILNKRDDESLDQRVKRLEFTNKLLVINFLVFIVGFFIFSFRVYFVIGGIVDNIDEVIAIMSGVSNQIQAIDNSLGEISEIFAELKKVFFELSKILSDINYFIG